MTPVLLSVRRVSLRLGRREMFRDLSFDLRASHSLGVLGDYNGGRTLLLRLLAGLVRPAHGEVLIDGHAPRDATLATRIAYFAGGDTLPPSVPAAAWGALGNGDEISADRRPIRALSPGGRQLLGLRTVLSRPRLQLVVLDEPWDSLDAEGMRWLTSTLEMKRDRGAAIVVASQRSSALAELCDAYLFLFPHTAVMLKAHEISPIGPVTGALLDEVAARVRDRTEAIARQVPGPPATR